MKRLSLALSLLTFLILMSPLILSNSQLEMDNLDNMVLASWPGGLIIDHTCINLGSIPTEWIDAAQDNIRIHYAHTSHGGQITTGLDRIEAADGNYSYARGSGTLPVEADALCMLDGNPPHSYITPDLYWETPAGVNITQDTLDNNPTINVSLWSWCTQLDYYSDTQVQQYLDTMSAIESANPDVMFVYMTCNAQATGSSGYNRWQNNEMIRQYCTDNSKVLFDFADLDCWSDGDQNTYEYVEDEETYQVPVEHTDFNGGEAGHTTYTSCEQKGQAFWWLVASLAGWNAPEPTTTLSSAVTTSEPTTTLSSAVTTSEPTTSSSASTVTTSTTSTVTTSITTETTSSTSTTEPISTPDMGTITLALGVILVVVVLGIGATRYRR
ncbi:MAG: hypothetical protein RTU92_06115 [Candidatus Thorarchaeota archaeon]